MTLLIPTRYNLPWSRMQRAEHWMKATVAARTFDAAGHPATWVVEEMGCVLNRDNEWEVEPQPSSRDADFIARTRFHSAEGAASFAKKHFETYRKGSR